MADFYVRNLLEHFVNIRLGMRDSEQVVIDCYNINGSAEPAGHDVEGSFGVRGFSDSVQGEIHVRQLL